MSTHEIKIVNQLARGTAYAEACFETFRVLYGQVFELVAHQQRLQQSMAQYGWKIDQESLTTWFEEAIAYAQTKADNVLIRLTVSGADAAWGLMPKTAEWQVFVQAVAMSKHAELHLRSVEWPFALQLKTGKFTSDYAQSLRAAQVWKSSLQTSEQALVCCDDKLLSTLTANVLLYYNSQWHTPMGLGVLAGVVRSFLLQKKIVIEAECSQAWLQNCEAMACINSGVFVQPVKRVNGRVLDDQHAAFDTLYDVLEGEWGVKLNDAK